MNINVSLSTAPGIATNYLVVAVYDSTALGTVVASQAFAAPHTSSQNVSFTGLNYTTYYVKTWESPTTDPSGTLRDSFLYDPDYQNAEDRDDMVLTMGETAGLAAGVNGVTPWGYVDPASSLVGWLYSLERRGTGTLVKITEYTLDINNNPTSTNPNDVLQEGEILVFHFQPQITIVSSGQSQTAIVKFGGFNLITADISLTSSAAGTLNMIQGTTPIVNVTLPDPNTVPDYQIMPFMHNGGSAIVANIIAGTGSIYYLNQTRSTMFLCQSEELHIFANGGNWYVFLAQGNFKTVGDIIDTYQKGTFAMNRLLLNGTAYSRAQYPRLWEWIADLDLGLVAASDTTWNTQHEASGLYLNQGLFSPGDGSTTFRLPNLCNNTTYATIKGFMPGYMRAVDGIARKAGSYQTDRVGNFQASLSGPQVRIKYSTDNTLVAIANGPSQPLPTLPITAPLPLTPFAGYQPATGTNNPNALNNETATANIGVYKVINF